MKLKQLSKNVCIFFLFFFFCNNFERIIFLKKDLYAFSFHSVPGHGERISQFCPQDLIFFKYHSQNSTIHDARNSNIQKTIHFFAKSNCITPEIHKVIQLWKSTQHSIELHSLEDVKKHILNSHTKFSSAKRAWKCAVTHEARLDLARFIILNDFGGLSVDIDTIPTNSTFTKLYHHPSHEYISEGLSRSSNISLAPRIVASTKNNSILYANFLSSTALQYRQHVHNKTNFELYKDSRWEVYGSWQWNDRYPNYGFMLIENFDDSNNILKKVEFSKESKQILSLEEAETDGCVNFESRFENKASDELHYLLESQNLKNVSCGNEKLFLIENVMPKKNAFFSERKIPKIIHMTAKTKCITAHVKKYVDEWKNIPNYSFILHDDDVVERLFQNFEWSEFPLLKKITKCISNGAMKADLWRYLLLWRFGGVYTDLDNGIGKHFNNASFITDDMDALFEVERGGFPSQYFFAGKANVQIFLFSHQV